MCGISGIISSTISDVSFAGLKRMTDVLKHRGPDGEGHWISENRNVGFGHRRLSIIDLSESGRQPMHYLDRYTITYNGEIYNYVELKEFLLRKGYRFHTKTDTEVLLALYDLKKEKCLEELDGMFAFAIWDNKEETLFCARDRFGEKPFFYHYVPGKYFAFASEMKALFINGTSRRINNTMLFNYLTNSYLDNPFNKPETFYSDIKKLEAAHYLVIKDQAIVEHKSYWNLNLENRSDILFDDACEKFKELLIQSVRTRLRSDVTVGSSLSGGLDSSTIVCIINSIHQNSNGQKTFSAIFPGYEKDETEYIKMVETATNVSAHYTKPNAETLAAEMGRLFYHLEEPFATGSQFAQWEVMKLAAQNETVVLLDGQGADEVLAGYTYYYRTFFQELYRNDKKVFRNEYDAYKAWGGNHFNFDFKFKMQAMFPKLYNHYLRFRSKPLPHPDIHRDYYGQFKSLSYAPVGFVPVLNYHLNSTLRVNGMFEALLRYGDRNSMAFSREVRLPFLNHELVEFVYSLPSTFKIHTGWTKYLLRKSYENFIPAEITWRKEKIGYAPPQEQWMESLAMRSMALEATNYLAKEKILDSNHLRKEKMWEYIMVYYLLNNG